MSVTLFRKGSSLVRESVTVVQRYVFGFLRARREVRWLPAARPETERCADQRDRDDDTGLGQTRSRLTRHKVMSRAFPPGPMSMLIPPVLPAGGDSLFSAGTTVPCCAEPIAVPQSKRRSVNDTDTHAIAAKTTTRASPTIIERRPVRHTRS